MTITIRLTGWYKPLIPSYSYSCARCAGRHLQRRGQVTDLRQQGPHLGRVEISRAGGAKLPQPTFGVMPLLGDLGDPLVTSVGSPPASSDAR